MKTYLTKLLAACILVAGISAKSFAVNYVSAGPGPASWNVATSWTPNGIPTSTDNVTIAVGHTITNNVTSNCNDLTVLGQLTGGSSMVLYIKGNYVVTGTEAGAGTLAFSYGVGSLTISGTGTFSTTMRYSFIPGSNRTISSNVTLVKTVTIAINSTVTNLGNVTLSSVNTGTSAIWINSTNSTLSLRTYGFMAGRTFTASASGNTVNLQYAGQEIPLTSSGYYNLNLVSSTAGTKTIYSNLIVANDLTMNANNHLNSNNFDITVGGDWTNAATFTATAGKTVTLNGTTAQTMSNTSGTTTFTNLTINNTNTGVTLSSGTYVLTEALTVSNGTFNTGGRPFTMTSTATQTARIAPISGTGAIAGNFTIQRFISTRDTTWSDLSSPVQASTFLDWDNELPAIYYGFYPTQYTYAEATDIWTPVTSSGTALTPGLGFEVFLSGDFDYADFTGIPINTVGVPNQGDQDLSGMVSFDGSGYNLVGNPFASSISWDVVFAASSGILNTYDVFDFASGNYATFGLGTEIGAAQGFWVYANAPGPTFIVNESAKTTSSNSSIRSMVKQPYFTLKLSNNDPKNHYYHVLKVDADNSSSDGWDSNDHPFRKSLNKLAPSIYTSIYGRKAVINSLNPSEETFSMPVSVNAGTNGYYKIEADGFENMGDYSCIRLEDKLLNKIIDLNAGDAYSFQLNTDNDADRFILHFSKSGNCKTVENANNNVSDDLNSMVTILPTAEGNSINFNMPEATSATINVTNVMGQKIVESKSVIAETQTLNVAVPQDFSGVYMIRIESPKGVIIKKYVRK